jgi:hypothetical protein
VGPPEGLAGDGLPIIDGLTGTDVGVPAATGGLALVQEATSRMTTIPAALILI